MPELPEVESVRLGLEAHARGHRIARAESFGERVIRRAPHGLAPIIGKRIEAVARRGKFLWFELGDNAAAVPAGAAEAAPAEPAAAGSVAAMADTAAAANEVAPTAHAATATVANANGPQALIAHLGMSGQFRIDAAPERHLRACLVLDNGTRLDFVDQRTFGYLQPCALLPTADALPGGQGTTRALLPEPMARIARDPLDPAFTAEEFAQRLRRKRTAVKTALLDQQLTSGIGNIYADEALHIAGLHPRQQAASLKKSEAHTLFAAVTTVLREALAAGGTSFDELYVHVDGEAGYFQRKLRAYGRAGQPCLECGTTMESIVISGRSSVFCPRCQPLRRRKIR
ncbi:bifunctional DNA-formamidopyrimidine glycosylase/DNA-(apurinic or apyrimidinic site) lyase [Actinobaculum suis]|uniref:bifunctional DNA-formamidopyrimidine glycosylase/DNA-(apurinic or apyrimidinic site) lyase n=1 Tax=Actinobaculum suis TaxID=1657 RepID=UPI00163C9262|nr:bifunctional DNA-formamidopyrimidine glycosylase/DNA-(apurinic or apyrimidinic site) lyase [Actinobaculum suis]